MRHPARRAARGRLMGTAAASLAACLALGATAPAHARITSLVIRTRTSPAFGGASFGPGGRVGQDEQLDGTAYGTVDPADPANALIQDIALAPRNPDGTVSYSMDVSILKPITPAQGNRVLLYDVVNRGNKVVTGKDFDSEGKRTGDAVRLDEAGAVALKSGLEGADFTVRSVESNSFGSIAIPDLSNGSKLFSSSSKMYDHFIAPLGIHSVPRDRD